MTGVAGPAVTVAAAGGSSLDLDGAFSVFLIVPADPLVPSMEIGDQRVELGCGMKRCLLDRDLPAGGEQQRSASDHQQQQATATEQQQFSQQFHGRDLPLSVEDTGEDRAKPTW